MKILSMSGFVPEQVCDTVRFTQYPGDRNISHYCGYASDFISQVRDDGTIDGAVFPKTCDSTRIIPSYLSESGKFIYQLNVPSVGTQGAVTFFARSIKEYKDAVEKHYGVSIGDVQERADIINKRNANIREAYGNLGNISFSEYLKVIHLMLQKPLREQETPSGLPGSKGDKPVYVAGSFLSNIDVAKSIEDAGLLVVGDTLTESGRLSSVQDVNLSGDIYESVAESVLSGRLSPTRNGFRDIITADIDEMKAKGVRGVLFITQKYCEPYDFLYSAYKSAMDGIGMPILQVALNDTEDSRKTGLAFEAFADTI